MGLYNDKKKLLKMCEELLDSGKDFIVIGYDKSGRLWVDVNDKATEVSLGKLLFAASYNKLFGCGLNYYTDMVEGKIQGGGKITCKGNIDWEIKDDENAALEHVVARFRVDSNTMGEAHCIVFTERGGLFHRKKRYCYDFRGKKIAFNEPRQRRDFLYGDWHCSLEQAIQHYRNCEEGKFKVTFEKITL